MLVAVIMMFLALSFTGVSVLNVSYLSRSASAETIENIKLQYQMESRINQALWQINTGVRLSCRCIPRQMSTVHGILRKIYSR